MEQFVVRLAVGQKRAGTPVAILALRDGPLREHAESQGLDVTALDARRVPHRIAASGLATLRFMPDVVHVHNPASLHYGVLCAGLVGCPLVMTFHGRGKGFYRMPTRLEWHAVARLAVVSHAAVEELAGLAPSERITVVHNGIEPPPKRNVRDSLRQQLGVSDALTLLTVARMDSFKGHRDLLHALSRLRDRGVHATALFAGDGAERPVLERLARELALDDRWVRFLGFRNDVADLLEAADVFVLPSLAEGLPLSLLEAMGRGIAIVATAVGGMPEAVTNEREALLVPPREPAALATALERVLISPSLRSELATAAAERVRTDFSFERMLREYDGLYRSVNPAWTT